LLKTAPEISVIVPVLNEAAGMVAALKALAPMRGRGVEVIVVDGGSTDGTLELAGPLADQMVSAPRGRARQMNAGAAVAHGRTLLFLHADTRLPMNADELVALAVGDVLAGRQWGRFDVRIEGRSIWLRVVARMMNLRSRLTGIATGDQAIFVARSAFRAVGGFPDIPLMEDIALSKALLRLSRPVCLAARVTTSGRRWETHGVWRTILFMWWLRLRYFFGADPYRLALEYGYVPHES
jgi:rSAM/selenodomain-associated transferase 2